eukprot:Em0026g48a
MGSILRSEEMMLLQLLLQSDSAYACVRELGEVGKVEFKDLNAEVSAFQRKFVNELRRCEEMERMLRFFVSELEKAGIPHAEPPLNCQAPDPHLLIDLETLFTNEEESLKQLNANQESLKKNLLDLKELKQILDKAQTFFQEGEQVLAEAFVQQQTTAGVGAVGGAVGGAPALYTKQSGLLGDADGEVVGLATRFTFRIGVIPAENLLVFTRVLWRVCRGNVFVKHAQIDEPLEDPATGDPVVKSVFILFFQGEQLDARIKKLCDGAELIVSVSNEFSAELIVSVSNEFSAELIVSVSNEFSAELIVSVSNEFSAELIVSVSNEFSAELIVSVSNEFSAELIVSVIRAHQCLTTPVDLRGTLEGKRFRATLYACPESASERQQVRLQVGARIAEVESVLQNTKTVKEVSLGKIAQSVEAWQQKVKKIKAIYHAMNMFNLDISHQSLVAECWCPVKDFHTVQEALNRGTQLSGSPISAIINRISTPETPPTYYKVNKFTSGFQAIVESYGVASYRELNPTPYAIITFPFLFGVMFGDIGHGLMMLIFACVLIIFEKKLAKTKAGGEFLSIVFSGRYLLLLMGLFSIYTGIIYNTLYSRTTNIFGSAWRPYYYGPTNRTFNTSVCAPSNTTCYPTACNLVYCDAGSMRCVFPTEAQRSRQPYPFGLDPMWLIAANKLTFSNSYKMKMSIILGLFQLLFGVILSIVNNIKARSVISIVGVSIPRVLFLMGLIGWLVFLMFYKWCRFYSDPTKAPNLLLTLIYMFLDFGSSPNTVGDPVYSVFGTGEPETAAQRIIQVILVITAGVCIPWMLLMKPIYQIVKSKSAEKKAKSMKMMTDSTSMTTPMTTPMVNLEGHDSKMAEKADMSGVMEKGEMTQEGEGEDPHAAAGHGGHGQTPSEILVFSAIHTIEYCLGTISNTASYLRLWALSLAHEQLSEVLWIYAIAKYNIAMFGSQIPGFGFIIMFALWAVWAVLTIGILLVLEGLSAFLHALRLHWIEFQNKFYEGEGRKFKPLSFAVVLSGEEDE